MPVPVATILLATAELGLAIAEMTRLAAESTDGTVSDAALADVRNKIKGADAHWESGAEPTG